MLAIADEDNEAPDLTPWHALQTWLENGEHRVTIPYAKLLARSIPALAVRLRRDFAAILNLIRAHGILHQATRERDSDGRIVATFDDYSIVRELVADLVSEGVEATVSSTIRGTVSGVQFLSVEYSEGVTVSALAQHLELDKSAVSRRTRVAVERGYLKNLEDRKGKPARLMTGDPLPDDREVLPKVEALERRSVADHSGADSASPAPVGNEGVDWKKDEMRV